MAKVPEKLRLAVRDRAAGRCEYCLMPEGWSIARHEPDHIVAEQHGGEATLDNLAWSCAQCNRYKGTNLTSIDPLTCRIVTLFNPRTQQWKRHFKLEGAIIEPLTASGRVTVRLLRFNKLSRTTDRLGLIETHRYP